jgi:hypothetical protein
MNLTPIQSLCIHEELKQAVLTLQTACFLPAHQKNVQEIIKAFKASFVYVQDIRHILLKIHDHPALLIFPDGKPSRNC